MPRQAIILFLLFWCAANGYAQPVDFKSYQVERGLSNNTVTCSLQDRKGFMWFGTKDGLNRFDGTNFKIFRNSAGDSNTLGNNSITKLFEDKSGVIWVGTERGLYRYNEAKENFDYLPASLESYIQGIDNDKEGNLWFISRFRLFRYKIADKQVTEYPIGNNDYYTTLCQATDGNMWAASGSGNLGFYNAGTGNFSFVSLFSHSRPTVSTYIERIFDSGDGFLLIGTSNQGVKSFDLKTHDYSDILTYQADGTEIFARDFIKNSPAEYWIGTENGIYIYNTVTHQSVNLQKSYNDPYSLSDNAVYSLSKDHEGGIWIGTYFGGVNYYPRQNIGFQKYFPQKGQNAISGNAVREIVEDKRGNIWIGTEDAGLNKFNPQTGTFKNFQPNGQASGIAHTNIHGLLVDGDTLWIGTFEHGLDKMDLKTEKVIRHYVAGPNQDQLKSNFIYSIYQTRAGQVFLATSNGFYRYDRRKDNFQLLDFFPFNTFYSSIQEDNTGTIWVGTFNAGLFFYNPAKQLYGHYKVMSNGEDVLIKTRITKLYQDRQANIWISTEDKLYCLDSTKKISRVFSDRNGLPSNLIYNTLEDNDGNLFITTSRGMARYDVQTKTISIFTQANGLLNDQFNYSSGFKDNWGRMYFGSVKGMITFMPGDFHPSVYTPPVYFTNFETFNKNAETNSQQLPLNKSLLATNKLVLPHNQSTFSISFSALTYSSPRSIQYAYKLGGLDNAWNYIGSNQRVYFTNLPPNTYQLSVKSTNSNGNWADNITVLSIEILPPWWKSTLAYLVYLAAFIAGVILVFRLYHNRQLAKQKRRMEVFEIKKEKEFYQSKLDFFTKIAHEIRTPLTLIKAPMEKVLKQSDSLPQIEKYLLVMNKNTDRLLTLTNQLLDFRKIESDHFLVNPTRINIAELLRNSCASFQSAAEQKQLQLHCIAPESVFADADEESTLKIVSNLLDNAIKYGKHKVTAQVLPVKPGDAALVVVISNDGLLIPEALHDKVFEPFFRMKETEKATGTGIGLSLARSLAQLQKGDLTLSTADGVNSFFFTLPV